MKKLVLLILLLSSFGLLKAQISLGAEAGYTRAWMNYGNIILPQNAITHVHSYNASVRMQYQLGQYLSATTAPGYVRRGAACRPTIGWGSALGIVDFPADAKMFLHFIDLPVSLQGHLSFGKGRWELMPSLGYGVAMMLHAREEIFDLETLETVQSNHLGIGKWRQLKRFDQGLRAAMGLARNMGQYQVYVRATYHYGLRDMERFMTSKNRALNLNLGVLVNL